LVRLIVAGSCDRFSAEPLGQARTATVGRVLLLINGAPGVGKSTLAERYAEEHPLALIVDIDSIRTRLGRWADVEESKLVARDLSLALASAHLANGYDVVVPQFLGRPEFRTQLESLAGGCGVDFVEVVLTGASERIVERFRARRNEHAHDRSRHPEADLGGDAVESEIARANEQLVGDAQARGVRIIATSDGPAATYRALAATLGRSSA
jgi:predicted kinase